jgi:Na+/H+-dicarboxylate symporter
MKALFKHRALQILLLLCLYFVFYSYIPLDVHRLLYCFSLFIKEILILLLPLTVFFYIGDAIISFQKKAPLFVLYLFVFEGMSNFLSVYYATFCSYIASFSLSSLTAPNETFETFTPLFKLHVQKPAWYSADKGALLAIVLSLAASILSSSEGKKLFSSGKRLFETILTKGFSPLIPLFTLGFVAKTAQSNTLTQLLSNSASLFIWIFSILCFYLFLLFFIGSNFNIKKTILSIKNLLEAGSIAFTSGCSLSTMPSTIKGVEKNLKEPSLAKSIIPATTNIQQIGDCIINTFLCYLLYSIYFKSPPPPLVWINFTLFFVLARYATAAVLGGAIFLMLPIYEKTLHFTPEMISIILSLNILLDPIVTASNVLANGALCQIFEKFWVNKAELKKQN